MISVGNNWVYWQEANCSGVKGLGDHLRISRDPFTLWQFLLFVFMHVVNHIASLGDAIATQVSQEDAKMCVHEPVYSIAS